MTLFKKSNEVNAPTSDKKGGFSLFVTKSKGVTQSSSVVEVLEPETTGKADASANGLFIRKPKDISQEPRISSANTDSVEFGEISQTDLAESVSFQENTKPIKSDTPKKEPIVKKFFKAFNTPRNKSEKPKTADRSKSLKTPKPPKKDKQFSKGSIPIVTQLEGGQVVHWVLNSEGLSQASEPSTQMSLSFSKNDCRFSATTPLSYGAASDIALGEIGEDIYLVNASKTFGAVYAIGQSKLPSNKGRLAPGFQIIDKLIRSKGDKSQDVVVGFLLDGNRNSSSLAVLYYINKAGEAGAPQITVNPENMEFTLTQFVTQRRINLETTRTVIFDNKDFLEHCHNILEYPNEAVWQGVSVRKLTWSAALASCTAAAVVVSYTAFQFVNATHLAQQIALDTKEIKTLTDNSNEKLSKSVLAFANAVSLSPTDTLERAQQLWLPATKVILTAKPTEATYTLTMPLVKGNRVDNSKPSVAQALTTEELSNLIKSNAPTGCTRDGLAVTGSLNEVQVSINCTIRPSSFTRYQLD